MTLKALSQSVTIPNADTQLTISALTDDDSNTAGAGLTKVGAGTLILSSIHNNHTGTTVTDGGTLQVQGNYDRGAFTVNSNATLTGTGTIGPLNVNTGGVMKIGPGALTVQGSATLKQGSTFTITFGGQLSANEHLTLNGTGNISGAALAVSAPAVIAGTKFTLI